MEAVLMIFAVTMACAAVAVAVICLIIEANEAYRISHFGWVQGHRRRR